MNRVLNRRRMGYAWIVGGVLWISWLASMLLRPGYLNLAGQVLGADYLQFYAAGYTLRLGQSARLYDMAYQGQLQRTLIGPELTGYHAFITPPFLAWLYTPLAALPYTLSFAVWSLLGLLALWLSLRLLGAAGVRRVFAWSLTWYPVFAAITYGQNSLLSLALLSLVYFLWRRKRLWGAGLVCSLLLYKPQLILGVSVLWLLDWRKQVPALLGLALGGMGLATLTVWLLPAASWAYVDFARHVLPGLPNWHEFPLWNLHTIRGFWRLLLPRWPAWSDGLSLLMTGVGLFGFVRFWQRNRGHSGLLFAGGVVLTLWITPHAMIYDWTLLLIPAVLLWEQAPRRREQWKLLYSAIWLVSLVSWPLTLAQQKLLPFAVQVSVPMLVFVVYLAWRWTTAPTDPLLELRP